MKLNKAQLSTVLFALATSVSASAAGADIKKMKVMEVTENAGTIWGIRLNENVNRIANPRAYDADLDCQSEPGQPYPKIELMEVPAGTDRGGEPNYIFTEFGYEYLLCESVREEILKNFEDNKTSCIYHRDSGEIVVTDDESKCDD